VPDAQSESIWHCALLQYSPNKLEHDAHFPFRQVPETQSESSMQTASPQ